MAPRFEQSGPEKTEKFHEEDMPEWRDRDSVKWFRLSHLCQ